MEATMLEEAKLAVCAELESDILSQGIDLFTSYLLECKSFLLQEFHYEVDFSLKSSMEEIGKYMSAHLNKKDNNYNIFIGKGLIVRCAELILNEDEYSKIVLPFYTLYPATKYKVLAQNMMYVSLLAVFINHEIAHIVYNHIDENQDNLKQAEACADCFSGGFLVNLYETFLLQLNLYFSEIKDKEATASCFLFIGVGLGCWELSKIFFTQKGETHPLVKYRPILMLGMLMAELNSKGHPANVLKNHLCYLYESLYTMSVEEFNEKFKEYTALCCNCEHSTE